MQMWGKGEFHRCGASGHCRHLACPFGGIQSLGIALSPQFVGHVQKDFTITRQMLAVLDSAVKLLQPTMIRI